MYLEFHRKEKQKEASNRYRERHPETILKSWLEIREVKNQKLREKYAENPEPKREKNREWNVMHPVQIKELEKKRKLRNTELFNLQNQQKSRNYRQNHPERILEYDKKRLEKMTLSLNMDVFEYVRSLFSWSRTIKKRDDNKCQICGNKSNASHHIFFKSKYPGLSLNIHNGISLCDDCHYEVHSLNGGYKPLKYKA